MLESNGPDNEPRNAGNLRSKTVWAWVVALLVAATAVVSVVVWVLPGGDPDDGSGISPSTTLTSRLPLQNLPPLPRRPQPRNPHLFPSPLQLRLQLQHHRQSLNGAFPLERRWRWNTQAGLASKSE